MISEVILGASELGVLVIVLRGFSRSGPWPENLETVTLLLRGVICPRYLLLRGSPRCYDVPRFSEVGIPRSIGGVSDAESSRILRRHLFLNFVFCFECVVIP